VIFYLIGQSLSSLSRYSFYAHALKLEQVQAFFREISKAMPEIRPGINAFYERSPQGRPGDEDNWRVLRALDAITPDTAKTIDDTARGFWFKSRWERRRDQEYLVVYGPET
jgi:hypothetical protein